MTARSLMTPKHLWHHSGKDVGTYLTSSIDPKEKASLIKIEDMEFIDWAFRAGIQRIN